MFANAVNAVSHATLGDLIDVLIIAFLLYTLFLVIKDTKSYQMAVGLGIFFLLFLVTQWGRLVVSNRILRSSFNYLIIAVIVLFQGEIRRFFTSIGSRSLRRPFIVRGFQEKIEDLFLALDYLSQRKIGALIAIEKEISLSTYSDRGTRIGGLVSKDLLVSIFFPHSPLHDGAVIIKGNKIVSAGCLLPLPASHNLSEDFLARTRHLAAIGLSQETDAAVVVVSEETGAISLARKGILERISDKEEMKERLIEYIRNK